MNQGQTAYDSRQRRRDGTSQESSRGIFSTRRLLRVVLVNHRPLCFSEMRTATHASAPSQRSDTLARTILPCQPTCLSEYLQSWKRTSAFPTSSSLTTVYTFQSEDRDVCRIFARLQILPSRMSIALTVDKMRPTEGARSSNVLLVHSAPSELSTCLERRPPPADAKAKQCQLVVDGCLHNDDAESNAFLCPGTTFLDQGTCMQSCSSAT